MCKSAYLQSIDPTGNRNWVNQAFSVRCQSGQELGQGLLSPLGFFGFVCFVLGVVFPSPDVFRFP